MKTIDYSIFKNIAGNRKINFGHVDALAEAMKRKNLLEYFPILLNEYMEIIDGQHRLRAGMKNSFEIHYVVVPGLNIEDVMSINTHSKSWGMMDFIESWIQLDKPHYKTLLDFMKRYEFSPSIACGLLSGYYGIRGGSATLDVKSGNFKVVSLSYAEKIAEQIIVLSKFADPGLTPKTDREFISALTRLNGNKDFDIDRLTAKLSMTQLKIQKRLNEKYYIIQIEELYNFKNSKKFTELYKSTYRDTKVKGVGEAHLVPQYKDGFDD